MADFTERDLDNIASILDYCDKIIAILNRFESDYDLFKKDYVFKDALLMNIFQIGEATNRLSDDCKNYFTDIPWHEIYATRNIIAHGYIKIDDDIIWNIVINDIEFIKKRLEEGTISNL